MSNVIPFKQPPQPTPNHGRITDMNAIGDFIFAGNATFTIRNTQTGNRYTYKVKCMKYEDPDVQALAPFFVTYLTGSNNTRDYSYMGTIFHDKRWEVAHTYKSKLRTDSLPWRALNWLLRRAANAKDGIRDTVPEEFQFWHEGKCARCGRPLTDPASIERGYGPLCDMIERQGGANAQ